MNSRVSRRSLVLGAAAATGLVLTGCNASAGRPADDAPSGAAAFRYTDARGRRIELPARPEVVVAQSSAAATLWEFGFKVQGAYGELKATDGKLSYQAGRLDLSQLTVVGDSYGAFDVEKYAAMAPQLLVDLMFVPGQLWYLPEKQVTQIEAVAPTLGMEMLNLNLLQIIDRFSALAALLGADVGAPAVTDAKAAFEAEVAKVRAAVTAKPGLTVLGVAPSPNTVYIANAAQHPDFAYLKSLGVNFVDHRGKATDYFTEVSYEKLDDYAADVILVDSRDPDLAETGQGQATWKALPAARAGQVYAWQPAAPYSWTANVPVFADFATALTTAKVL